MIAHIFPNAVIRSIRGMKETKSLRDTGQYKEILIIGLWETNLPEWEILDRIRKVWRIPLKTRRLSKNLFFQSIKYMEFFFKIYRYLKQRQVWLIQIHSLDLLPLGVLLKVLLKTKLVYDAHELETERIHLRGIRKRLGKVVEHIFIRWTDSVIVVNDSIAAWYKHSYPITHPITIMNIPDTHKMSGSSIQNNSNVLHKHFNISNNDLIFIYLGNFSVGRGIKRLLKIFQKVSQDRHIVFMGNGILEKVIAKEAHETPNIHLHPPVSFEKIIPITSGADIGVCFIENICLSYYYSLPNKFFQYLFSGLPIISYDSPEQKRILTKYQCGWSFEEDNDDSFSHFINTIKREQILRKKVCVLETIKVFSWETEASKLISIYYNLLKTS